MTISIIEIPLSHSSFFLTCGLLAVASHQGVFDADTTRIVEKNF
jgi:hypothetical protein